MKPFFSIITPTYNREDYLAQMIKGVQNQSFSDWELIIVDDGGTDSTPLLMKYFLKDKRIRYYKRKKNMGIGYTRNEGNKHAKGKWIVVCDSDEIWHWNRLQMTYDYIKKHPDIDFIYGGMMHMSTWGNYSSGYNKPTILTANLLRSGHQGIIHGTSAYKKWIADKIGYRNEQRVNDDFWFVIDCWNAGVNFGILEKKDKNGNPIPLMGYRILNDGASLVNYKKIRKEIKEKLKTEYIRNEG